MDKKNELSIPEIEGRIEAVLFSVGDKVSVDTLSQALEIDKDTITKIVHNMMDKYDDTDRGIRIIEIEDAFQMCS